MARKKARAAKGRRRAASKRRAYLKSNFKKTMAGAAILFSLVVAVAVLLHYSLANRRRHEKPVPVLTLPAKPEAQVGKPAYEVFPPRDVPARPSPALPEVKTDRPKVAIIIDDLGYDRKMAHRLLSLGGPLTFAILPFVPFERKIAAAVHAKGFETMLHLPMEPIEYPHINPGPGALLTTMAPDQLIDQLSKDLDEISYARGVNNHMGSRMTADSTQLYQIFSIIKKRNLYFIDSRTTADTLCKPSARLFQLSFSQRDVFLDNVQKPQEIRQQVRHLLKIAETHGEAVGIGHPYPVTYEVLKEMLPEIQEKVQLVPASEVVHTVG